MPRRHIDAGKIGEFLKQKHEPGKSYPRLAYVVKRNGDVVYAGRNHRDLEPEHARDIAHRGFFQRVGENVGHFPYSTSVSGEPVPPEVMGEIEAEMRKRDPNVRIGRMDPI